MSVKVYVEGGGSGRELRTKCRQGFSTFFRNASLVGRMPKIIACGAQDKTCRDFRTALANAADNEFIVLLVDSEGPVDQGAGPWLHLKNRDDWDKPDGADDDNAHLMVQCMEAWFLADKDALARYFGSGFNLNALPGRPDVEHISKSDLENGLKNATRQCKPKGEYHKGRHSFAILAELDAEKVIAASPHAKRLVDVLKANA